MTFLLWHRNGDARIASPRLVLRAAEVPPLRQANELCEQLAQLHREERERIAIVAGDAAAQGHAQGLDEGRRMARDEHAAALLLLAQTSEREREQLRGELGALALQVVRKMLGRFADDTLLAALAETAAREALPAQQLVVVVHPDLCDAVRERLAAQADAAFEVRGDAACTRDTCRIETEHGSVDASLEGQLVRLAAAWESKK